MAILSLFVQLCLVALTYAAPIMETTTVDNSITFGTGGGIIGFIVLILDIIVWSKFLLPFP